MGPSMCILWLVVQSLGAQGRGVWSSMGLQHYNVFSLTLRILEIIKFIIPNYFICTIFIDQYRVFRLVTRYISLAFDKFFNIKCASKIWLKKPGMVAHSFNPSTRKVGASRFLSSRPAWSTKWVPKTARARERNNVEKQANKQTNKQTKQIKKEWRRIS